jgi:hypothetical protein
MLRNKITEVFMKVDDFSNEFVIEYTKYQLPWPNDIKPRNRKAGLCDSEVITILIAFHGGQFRNFKHFYLNYVCLKISRDLYLQ